MWRGPSRKLHAPSSQTKNTHPAPPVARLATRLSIRPTGWKGLLVVQEQSSEQVRKRKAYQEQVVYLTTEVRRSLTCAGVSLGTESILNTGSGRSCRASGDEQSAQPAAAYLQKGAHPADLAGAKAADFAALSQLHHRFGFVVCSVQWVSCFSGSVGSSHAKQPERMVLSDRHLSIPSCDLVWKVMGKRWS